MQEERKKKWDERLRELQTDARRQLTAFDAVNLPIAPWFANLRDVSLSELYWVHWSRICPPGIFLEHLFWCKRSLKQNLKYLSINIAAFLITEIPSSN